jgi:hypothetical protein
VCSLCFLDSPNPQVSTGIATITLTGPSDVWFGIGFHANLMQVCFSCHSHTHTHTLSLSLSLSLSLFRTLTLSHTYSPTTLFLALALAQDEPYAIVVNGSGGIEEHKLADHSAGMTLTSSLTLLNSSVSQGETYNSFLL